MEKKSDFDTNDEPIELPPGFRFHPTDEELITCYLSPKVLDSSFSSKAIGEVDLNKVEPWDLPWKAKMGEKEWYFFCIRDRKYPTGLRTNRATNAGYWKATGKDKEIFRAKYLVGMRKTLVFYKGRAPKGEKTNWVMHEYRLEGKHYLHNVPKNDKNESVICRIFKKSSGGKTVHISGLLRSTNCGDNSPTSELPLPTDLSSDENHTNTAFYAEGSSHVTCFSNPTVDPGDVSVDDFTSTTRTCVFSTFPFIFPRDSNPNSIDSTQTIPFVDNLNNPDSVLMQDQPLVRILLDNNVPNTKQNAKVEFSEDLFYQEVGFKPYEDLEFPNIFNAPVDLDCLLNN